MANDLAFFYQLIGGSYATVAARNFTLGVVDADDSGLTSAQIASLASGGKQLLAYASAGEAENFRDYWIDNNWSSTPPDFLLGQNPEWSTGYRVKFWDSSWQNIVIDRLKSLQLQGYRGAYLDVVDAYTVAEVQNAFAIDHPGGNIREEMVDFIKLISSTLKAIDPGFRIMVQNAVALLNETDIGSLSEALKPNLDYLAAIDGLGKETTFVLGDTVPIGWSAWDARYVENAVNAGKLVIGLEYPTPGNSVAEQYAYDHALAAGYVPYLDVRDHTGKFANFALNYQTLGDLPTATRDHLTDFANGTSSTASFGSGTSGDDEIIGDSGDNDLSGNGGNDTVYGLDGNDTLRGGDGHDRLLGWYGDDSISGGAGNDSLFGDFGADTLDGGDGNDYLYGWSENDLLNGGGGADVLYGDAGRDTVYGHADNDIVFGSTGDDLVYGGTGDDDLYGDEDNDTLHGESGNDRLYGWTGNDSLVGGDGNDSLSGDQGSDTISAGNGNDWVYAGDSGDYVTLGTGNDWAFGDDGNDTIYGEDGHDIVYAWEGNDQIFGGMGNDFISAEGGADYLHGGAGDDELYGGAGADLFAYDGGIDTIRDFTQGADLVQLIGFGADFFAISSKIFYAGGRATISFDATNSLNFDNIVDGSFTAGDFQFS